MSESRPPNLPAWAGDETEPFRAFRLTNFEAQRLSDGQLLGAFLRCTVEMLSRDLSGAVVEHLRHQADLAEIMLPPRAERPPAPKRHPWRRYASYSPAPDEEHQPSPETDADAPRPAQDKTPSVDAALNTNEVLDGAVLPEEDTTPGQRRDRKFEDEQIRDAMEDEFEKDTAYRREAEQFEADQAARLMALADHERSAA